MIKGATLAMFLSLANMIHELPNSANSRHSAFTLQYRLHRCIFFFEKNVVLPTPRTYMIYTSTCIYVYMYICICKCICICIHTHTHTHTHTHLEAVALAVRRTGGMQYVPLLKSHIQQLAQHTPVCVRVCVRALGVLVLVC